MVMATRLAGTDFANKRMTGVQHLGERVRQMVQNALDALRDSTSMPR